MIPGKKYKPEDFVEILWRRKWAIVVPVLVAGIATFIWSRTLPDRYRSQTVVLVVAPQVPENIIRPTVTESLQERLTAMRQEILSRTRLERIVMELDLYRDERKRLLMDEVIARMRDDVKVDVAKARRREDPASFTVGFEYSEPRTAMLVAERIASLFVRENVEGRSIQADVTSQFLQTQLTESLRRLQEHDAKLRDFRQRNAGRLPSQVQSNLQMIQNTRQELQNTMDTINRDRDRQITIERAIAEEEALGPAVVRTNDGDKVPMTAAQELFAARESLTTLKLRLKDDHPDVRATRRRITELEQKAAAEALQQPVTGAPTRPLTPGEVTRQRRLSGLRAEYDSLGRTIAVKRAEADRLESLSRDYKQRVDVAPALESELTQLMRDYETMQTTYTTLLKKSEDAKVASNVEERQVGQQFKIIDPARVPERPTSPDRLRMNLIGLLFGLGFGLAFAGLLEYRDTSLRTEEDVLVSVSLPVVALVPTVWTPAERKDAQRRRLVLVGTSALATVVLSAIALAWKLNLFGK